MTDWLHYLQDWFDPTVQLLPGMGCPRKDFQSATFTHKGHGRLEVRTLTTSSQLNDFLDWPFLQQVFQLERTITISKTEKTRHETVYGVTSLSAEQASPAQLLHILRSCGHVENSLHYPRDVTLHEDRTRFKNTPPLTLTVLSLSYFEKALGFHTAMLDFLPKLVIMKHRIVSSDVLDLASSLTLFNLCEDLGLPEREVFFDVFKAAPIQKTSIQRTNERTRLLQSSRL